MPAPLRPLGAQAFSRAAGAALVQGNDVRLLIDARENYPAWLDAIHGARHWIHFESYIVHEDESGREFAEALKAAARRGVRVRLLYDWLGALTATTWVFWERLRKAGVEVRAFNPPRLDAPLGWITRDHRKMLGVDGDVAFVTGLCVGDMWQGGARCGGCDPWRDTGLSVRGPSVADIEAAFAEIWDVTGAPLPADEQPAAKAMPQAGSVALRVIRTKPSTTGLFRLDQLVAAVARDRLWITDAYYVGAAPYAQGLAAAANDGVDVRLLMPGSGSDLPMIRRMTQASYRPLLEAGVRIFEWNGTMVHAKTAVADSRWARVGSSNLNVQSWLGNWELDVSIDDEQLAHELEDQYLTDLEHATEVVLESHQIAVADDRVARDRPRGRGRRGRRARRTGVTSRAARAGAVRVGQTIQAALTTRRPLGAAEIGMLLSGMLMLSALGAIGLSFPRLFAYPLGVLLVWLALGWGIQAARLRLWPLLYSRFGPGAGKRAEAGREDLSEAPDPVPRRRS
ncbi:MAG: phospholipase D-like domain-containing protein [Acidobacteriota bacterium]